MTKNALHPGAEFVAGWFADTAGRVYLASLPNPELKGTPAGEPNERHVIMRSRQGAHAFTSKWDRPGRAVYFGTATLKLDRGERIKANIAELVALHVDVDFKGVVETPEEIERILGNLPLPPTVLRHTGHGLQAFWRYDKAIVATTASIAAHERLLRLLADHLGGDHAVVDACHLMRMPGTINSKNGDRLPVRELVTGDTRYTPEQLEAWLAKAAPIIRRRNKSGNGLSANNPFLAYAATNAMPAPPEELLAGMVYRGYGGGGNVHDTLLSVTATLLTRGMDVDTVIAKCLAAETLAAARSGLPFDPVVEEQEIRGLCTSWLQKHPEIIERQSEIKTRPSGWWHGDIDVDLGRKWLVKRLITETGTGLLPGQWGTYKTFVALDLAGAVMTGTDFAGHAVKRKGGVLFVACEGRGEIPIRLEALNRSKCGNAERLPFFCLDAIPPLLEKKAAKKIIAEANDIAEEMRCRFDLPLALIVIDTVAAGAGYREPGEENDAAIAQRIMDTLAAISKATGAFVLAVDHFGKTVETGTRGSSAKESFADVVLALLGTKELAGAVRNPRMVARKRKSGPNGEEFAFTTQLVELGRDEDGDPIDTLVLEWGGSVENSQRSTWPRSLYLLHQVMTSLPTVNLHLEQEDKIVRAIDRELVRTEFYQRYPVDGDTEEKRQNIRRQRFFTAVKAAQQRGLIDVRIVDEVTFLWVME